MTWAEFNNLHERYSQKAFRIFRWALYRQFEKMLEAAQDNGFNNLGMVITRADSSDINNAFTKVYQDVGLDSGFRTWDEITDNKKARSTIETNNGKINVRAKWLNELRDISLDETIPARGAILTTSQEIFTDVVAESMAEGMTTSEIAKNLRKRWREIVPWRSWNIARTETLSAYNFGAEVASDETGSRIKKTWLASLDGRERASHRAVSGTVAINGSWMVEQPTGGSPDVMRFPGDPRASAANRVNCRCTVIREIV